MFAIVVIGAMYYLLAGQRKHFAPVVAPAGDDPPLAAEDAAREG